MTKEEFMNIIDVEIEKVKKDIKEAEKPVYYYANIAPNSNEHNIAIVNLNTILFKLRRLEECINLPAYARIQSMSDVEVENYKAEKIAEVEVKIKSLEAERNQEQQVFEQLKKEEQELIAAFASSDVAEQKELVQKGKKLHAKIEKYDFSDPFSILNNLDSKISSLKNNQIEIQNKDTQTIKDELSAKIDGYENLAELIDNKPITPTNQLMAEFAGDFEKQKQVAELITKHNQLKDDEERVILRMNLNNIPRELCRRIQVDRCCYDFDRNALKRPADMMKIVLNYESDFAKSEKEFNEQFTEEKLLKLCDDPNSDQEVDFDFLELHKDKIDEQKFEQLISYYNERQLLLKKPFKTGRVKEEIQVLNLGINRVKSEIYSQIISWYRYFNVAILDLNSRINFENTQKIYEYLKESAMEIKETKEEIQDLKVDVNEAETKIENRKAELQNERKNIINEIKSLATNNYEDIKLGDSLDFYVNLTKMNGAASLVYQKDLINKIYDEARAQAQAEDEEILAQKRL